MRPPWSRQDFTGCARNWVPHEVVEGLVSRHLGKVADELSTGESGPLNDIILQFVGIKEKIALVIQRGLVDYLQEMDRMYVAAGGEQEFRRLLARYASRPVMDDDLRKQINRVAGRLDLCTVEEARNLFVSFEEEKAKLARRRLEGLNKDYERWVLAKAAAENERERNLARTRCQELEEQLTLWESRLRPVEDQLAELRSQLAGQKARMRRAYQTVLGGSNRRKAEVVRGLYAGVVLHFCQVKRAKQVRSELLADQTEFKVSLMDVTSPRSCRRSRGPAPQNAPTSGLS